VNGLNVRLEIWRMMSGTPSEDDEVGGALLTGSRIYTDVRASLQDSRGAQALHDQGFETVKTVDCILVPETIDIRERDEIQVTHPTNHRYYGKRLRVLEVVGGGTHPSSRHGHLELKLRRIERGRTRQ
jgi:hypothetical protein